MLRPCVLAVAACGSTAANIVPPTPPPPVVDPAAEIVQLGEAWRGVPTARTPRGS